LKLPWISIPALAGKGLKDMLVTNVSMANIKLCGVQHFANKLQLEQAWSKM
jgi:hypothetical protein